MAFVALVALLCKWPHVLYLVILPLLGFLAGRLGLIRGKSWGRLGVLLGALYLPCLPGFFGDCGHCRLTWLKLFPTIPGVLPSGLVLRFANVRGVPDWAMLSVASLIVGVFLCVLMSVSGRGREWLVGAAAVALGWSAISAMVFYAMIRA